MQVAAEKMERYSYIQQTLYGITKVDSTAHVGCQKSWLDIELERAHKSQIYEIKKTDRRDAMINYDLMLWL